MNCKDDCHTYELDNFDPQPGDAPQQIIHFYRMALSGEKTAGVTNEEVIKALIHRLGFLNEKWMDGLFRCRENSMAITKLEEALMWLNRRTENRINRGIEGTHKA
jgi:hypothetical protein